jgi:3-phosphoshikimate 1-carboxyvinyltransferase
MPSPEQRSHIELDLSEQPDIAQTIAVTCCMLRIPFRLSGLATLKIKETDRLEALKTELAKLSFDLRVEQDSVLIWDGDQHPVFEMPCIDTYEDHRMAMAFAPAALYLPGLVVNNIEVVAKSYPQYWEHLSQAGFTFVDADIPVDENLAQE